MDFNAERKRLIETLHDEGIQNMDVLAAMLEVPRERFVEFEDLNRAYENTAMAIGEEQTISQPTVVAEMTALLLGEKHQLHKVLEVGTGSGYQSAVLSYLVDEVYTIERIEALLKKAEARFAELQYHNIHTRYADGNKGWKAHACYDGIIVTAAAPSAPDALLDQLCVGGCLVLPVGKPYEGQQLMRITRTVDAYETEYFDRVMFVPMRPGKI